MSFSAYMKNCVLHARDDASLKPEKPVYYAYFNNSVDTHLVQCSISQWPFVSVGNVLWCAWPTQRLCKWQYVRVWSYCCNAIVCNVVWTILQIVVLDILTWPKYFTGIYFVVLWGYVKQRNMSTLITNKSWFLILWHDLITLLPVIYFIVRCGICRELKYKQSFCVFCLFCLVKNTVLCNMAFQDIYAVSQIVYITLRADFVSWVRIHNS